MATRARTDRQEWITCRVFDGMFSDEFAVEVGSRDSGMTVFVDRSAVRNRHGNRGELSVVVYERDGARWALLPTSTRDTVPLHQIGS